MVRDFAGGPTIRRLRENRALTQEQLAKKADIHYSYVSKLEEGVRTNVSERVIARLARALKVQPYVLTLSPEQATQHLMDLEVAAKREAAEAS